MGSCSVKSKTQETISPSKLQYKRFAKITLSEPQPGNLNSNTMKLFLVKPKFVEAKPIEYLEKAYQLSMCILPGTDPLERIYKECQDTCFCLNSSDNIFIGVYDGHGKEGEHVVNFCTNFVKNFYQHNFKTKVDSIGEFLRAATNKCDDFIKLNSSIDVSLSGTTQVLVVLRNNLLNIANVGDSRAVLASLSKETNQLQNLQLTTDQKPETETELFRIIKSGGVVQKMLNEGQKVGPYRVWGKYSGAPGLAMSRSIGDSIASELGVICTPELIERPLEPLDQFVVVATDGVWGVMSNEEVVQFVQRYRKVTLKEAKQVSEGPPSVKNSCIAQLLCEEARLKWLELIEQDMTIIDDISCVILEFNQ